MTIHATDEGAIELLNDMLRNIDEDKILHLYQNNLTLDESTVIGDFTECDFTGYTQVTLTNTSWSEAGIVDGVAYSWYGNDPLEYTCASGSNMIYGYYVTNETGDLLWCESCFAGRIFKTNDVLFIQPKLSLNCINPTS